MMKRGGGGEMVCEDGCGLCMRFGKRRRRGAVIRQEGSVGVCVCVRKYKKRELFTCYLHDISRHCR